MLYSRLARPFGGRWRKIKDPRITARERRQGLGPVEIAEKGDDVLRGERDCRVRVAREGTPGSAARQTEKGDAAAEIVVSVVVLGVQVSLLAEMGQNGTLRVY